jgi:hypothetical protein
VRRFCLACSKKTGRLVARVCPSLESQRVAAVVQRQEKAKRARAQRREAQAFRKAAEQERAKQRAPQTYSIQGKDLQTWAREMWQALRKVHPDDWEPIPPITIGRTRYGGGYSTGVAWGGREAVVRLPRGFDPDKNGGAVLGTLLHELVHCRIYRRDTQRQRHGSKRAPHGRFFQLVLVGAARELWGFQVPIRPGAYKTTFELEQMIQARLWAGFTGSRPLLEEQPAQPAEKPAEGDGDVLLR